MKGGGGTLHPENRPVKGRGGTIHTENRLVKCRGGTLHTENRLVKSRGGARHTENRPAKGGGGTLHPENRPVKGGGGSVCAVGPGFDQYRGSGAALRQASFQTQQQLVYFTTPHTNNKKLYVCICVYGHTLIYTHNLRLRLSARQDERTVPACEEAHGMFPAWDKC